MVLVFVFSVIVFILIKKDVVILILKENLEKVIFCCFLFLVSLIIVLYVERMMQKEAKASHEAQKVISFLMNVVEIFILFFFSSSLI